jgi:hypothetical protein
MAIDIEAIFLDVGNTLRIVVEDESFQNQVRRDLMQLIGAKDAQSVFFDKLTQRWKEYRNWSFENLLEASEYEL